MKSAEKETVKITAVASEDIGLRRVLALILTLGGNVCLWLFPWFVESSLFLAANSCNVMGVFTRSSKLPANVFKIHVLMLDVCWIV